MIWINRTLSFIVVFHFFSSFLFIHFLQCHNNIIEWQERWMAGRMPSCRKLSSRQNMLNFHCSNYAIFVGDRPRRRDKRHYTMEDELKSKTYRMTCISVRPNCWFLCRIFYYIDKIMALQGQNTAILSNEMRFYGWSCDFNKYELLIGHSNRRCLSPRWIVYVLMTVFAEQLPCNNHVCTSATNAQLYHSALLYPIGILPTFRRFISNPCHGDLWLSFNSCQRQTYLTRE